MQNNYELQKMFLKFLAMHGLALLFRLYTTMVTLTMVIKDCESAFKADSQSSRSCGKWMRVPIQIH